MSARWKSVLGAALAASSLSLLAAPATAQSQHDMTFHTVPPCTVVDTRVAGGAFAANETRTYNVVGTGSLASQGGSSTGCNVPGFSNSIPQVQAVELAITIITPAGPGYLAANAADASLSLASVVTFQASDVLTNTTPVAVTQTSGSGDFKVQVAYASSHVVVRVVGYYSKPIQTVLVHPVPGNHTASGAALISALGAINNASATKRYLLQLEPGIYDLGASKLLMKPYVDIKGAGQEATVIQGGGFSSSDYGVVWGAAPAEVSDLQIKSTGSNDTAIAFYSPQEAGATRLHNVTFVASGGADNYAIRAAGGSPVIEECTLRAQGGTQSYGLVGRGTSRPTIKRTVIEVTNGSTTGYGMLFVTGAAPVEARDVQVRTTGASTSSYGIYVNDDLYQSNFRFTDCTIEVDGATTNRGIKFSGLRLSIEQSQVRAQGTNGIGIDASFGDIVIDHSEIAGAAYTVYSLSPLTTRIGSTRLEGGAVYAGYGTCAGVYDEAFTFYAGPTCP
jgi:hypothetical protein